MRLDKKNERELARRKGLAARTIIQSIWLLISSVIAYFLLRSLFASGYLTYDMFYSIGVPPTVPEGVILATLIFILVMIMQFFLILGYAFFSPAGRERPGDPTPYTTNYDVFQDDYRH